MPQAYLYSGVAFFELDQPHPFVTLTHYKDVIFSSAPHRPLPTGLETKIFSSGCDFSSMLHTNTVPEVNNRMDNQERFIAAIQESERFIYKLASAYTDTVNDRRDLVQEIIYQLWKSFHTFGEQSKVSTWIYRVALNVAVRQLKQSKKRVQTVAMDEQVLSHTDSIGHDEYRWNLLKQQIETLGLLDKGIVMLYLEGKSHDEIAEVTGISKSNVGTRIQRIKEKLKQQITKQL